MCGICGIINYNSGAKPLENTVKKMCALMRHRGPDDQGVYVKNNFPLIGLGHCRLSIIDLSPDGHQPMSNENNTIWIVFNGEIYNFRQLREELKNKRHKFKSNTDTETIIHLYEEYGLDCVKKLHGMFSFALWDENEECLVLARDRVGKKPLLYSFLNGVFCFASEFQALIESGFIGKDINHNAINYYLTFGYIPAPLTIYSHILKLPPAHILVFKNKDIGISQYWHLHYTDKLAISEREAQDKVLEILRDAVKIRLSSDVPLGAFLSGGIDSSAVVALMAAEMKQRVKTFSIGFTENDYNELAFARNIAKRFNTEHHEFIVKPKALEVLPLLVERFGEPYADSSCIPTYYVAQQTKQYVTVALNGDGGDELFAGYDRYRAMVAAMTFQQMPSIVQKAAIRLTSMLPDSTNHKDRLRRVKRFISAAKLPPEKRYLKWVGIFDGCLKGETYSTDFNNLIQEKEQPLEFISALLNTPGGISFVDSLLYTDTVTYLPNDLLVKVDITSMANSLEARSPFLDHRLIEFAAQLPPEYKMHKMVKKYILKKAIRGLIPLENINRRKMGFGMPVGEWFRNEMKEFLKEILISEKFFKRGYFKRERIKDMVQQHILKQKDYTYQLWALVMLELWHQRFID